ncbi:GNAT family N-acetyltransferase [Lysinibacillus capsici]|uniref:GNAT family N-acetyltransferase n=1 Tax=Lysinibacillus capsici TaxID=2115968 RepID=UPI0006CA36FC|nr:GNAT family N-acetyltransferase [Lysinibacillus sphaericus]
MIKVSEEQYPIIKQFISSAPTFVYSILDRMIEGAVYSDTAAFQTLLFHTKSGIYYVYGDENKTSIDYQLAYCLQQAIEQQKRFTLFSYSEQWNTKIEQLLNNQLRKLERYTFTFDENIYNHREKHGESDYEVKFITEPLIKNSLEFDQTYYEEYWDSISNFLKNGFGFCFVHKEQIISEAVSIFKSNEYAEIDIMTDSNFRGQGLASSIAETFIDHCLVNQLKPCWDCDISNTGSIHLGTKLGFTTPQKYAIYTKSSPRGY